MNAEFYTNQIQDNLRPLNAPDESRQASEKMLLETMKGGCSDLKMKCVAPSEQSSNLDRAMIPREPFGKLDRFMLPSQMNITPVDEPTERSFKSGDAISQEGTTQRLSLLDGSSIQVN